MKQKISLLFCLLIVGSLWGAETISEHTVMSEAFKLDTRTSIGGRMLHGTERISPVAENKNASAKLSVNGLPADGWTIQSPNYDSTQLKDHDWHAFMLKEGEEEFDLELLVLNGDDIEVHGGVLTKNETWSAGKLHVVRYWVCVPEGKTLTIPAGTIVKFCENTGIHVDGTLNANKAIFSTIEDDSLVGDTDQNGLPEELTYDMYAFEGTGTRNMMECTFRAISVLPASMTWKAGSVHHIDKLLSVPTGLTLTIEAGAIVKLATGAELKTDGGSIVASGALFTHIADDSEEAGGDTNGDDAATLPVFNAYKLTGFSTSSCEVRYLTKEIGAWTITNPQTLDGNQLYSVKGDITVKSGGTLTIEAGTILKLNSKRTITVESEGKLIAKGTRNQPIIFTSIKDDANGGDTNGDGNNTSANQGDWCSFKVSGTLDFEHVQVLYGGDTSSGSANSNESGVFNGMSGGNITLSKCVIAFSKFDGLFSRANTVLVQNTMIYDCDRGINLVGGTGTIKNCVVDHCRWGVMTEGGSGTFLNCSITNFYPSAAWSTGWGIAYWSGSLTARYCNVWTKYTGTQLYRSSFSKSDMISADPLFTDAEHGDFTLKTGSPLIDAGDGSVAPDTDYWGKPRMDCPYVANTGKTGANGTVPDIGVYEMPGTGAGACPDLQAVSVKGPFSATTGDSIDVTWQTANVGVAEAVASWTDTLYLVSEEEKYGNLMVPLGEYVVTQNILPKGKVTNTASFTVPPCLPGKWRLKVAVNLQHDLYESDDVENNTVFSNAVMDISLPTLTAGQTNVNLVQGGSASYWLDGLTSAGALLIVRGAGKISLKGNGNFMPVDGDYAWNGKEVADGVWLMTIPQNMNGQDNYVVISNDGIGNAGGQMEVILDALAVAVGSVRQMSNKGNVTLEMWGTGFASNMTATLRKGSSTRTCTELELDQSNHGWCTFNLDGLAAGNYDLVLKSGGKEASCLALTLTEGGVGPQWYCKLDMPQTLRQDREYTAYIEYGNTGDAELPAPRIKITSDNGVLLRYTAEDSYEDGLQLLATSATYPVSCLKPGEIRRIPILFRTPANISSSNVKLTYAYMLSDSSDFPWEENAAYMRPSWADDEAWGHILAALKASIGNTWDDYLERMRDNLDHLAKLGCMSARLDQVWQMEVNAALGADGGISTLAGGTDLARAGRGVGLAFSRSYSAQLFRRLRNSVLGRGWTHSYNYSAKLDSGKTTFDIMMPDGSTRSFVSNPNSGNFTRGRREIGYFADEAQTRGSGKIGLYPGGQWTPLFVPWLKAREELDLPMMNWRLYRTYAIWRPKDAGDKGSMSETDSEFIITERNGMFTAYSKTSLRPVRVGDMHGNQATLTWTNDKLMSVQHSDGQKLIFTYNGDLLASVSDDQGRTVRYGYTDGNLTSVTSTSGIVTRYAYEAASNAPKSRALNKITYADGTTRNYVYDNLGRIASTSVNGTQQTVQIICEGNGTYRAIGADGAEAVSYKGPYGETLLSIDPLGNQTRMEYDATTHQLLATTTPEGHRVSIAYDGDLNANRVVNGSGFATGFERTEDFASPKSFTDANGNSVAYDYNDFNEQTAVRYADGTSEGFAYDENTGDVLSWTNRRGQTVTNQYDAEGRIVKKTWSDGRTFTYTYNARGNVTKVTDSLTGSISYAYDSSHPDWLVKVTYPNNRWFSFTYDSIGRQIQRNAFDGHVLKTQYDSLGRAYRWTDGSGNLYRENVYDTTVGRLIRVNNGNGTYTKYTYDLAGHVTGIVHYAKNNFVMASFAYTYNADGQRIAMTMTSGTTSYSYDAAGQLVSVIYPNKTKDEFDFDPVGNRITANGVAYTKNTLNQYTQAGTDLFGYDADGNLTTWTNANGTTVYEYDVLNRLVKVTRPDHSVWSCQYDALGNRISVTDNGKKRETVYLDGVYADFENGAETKRYLGGIVENANGTKRYWHSDGLASVRAISNENGVRVGTMDYDVVGNIMAQSGETTDFGFVGIGDVRLDTTGLIFMMNRYYAKEIGRFIQMDPIGLDAGDACLYRYCGNDGANRMDFEGLESLMCTSLKSTGQTAMVVGTGAMVTGLVIGGSGVAETATIIGAPVGVPSMGLGTAIGTGGAMLGTAGVLTYGAGVACEYLEMNIGGIGSFGDGAYIDPIRRRTKEVNCCDPKDYAQNRPYCIAKQWAAYNNKKTPYHPSQRKYYQDEYLCPR